MSPTRYNTCQAAGRPSRSAGNGWAPSSVTAGPSHPVRALCARGHEGREDIHADDEGRDGEREGDRPRDQDAEGSGEEYRQGAREQFGERAQWPTAPGFRAAQVNSNPTTSAVNTRRTARPTGRGPASAATAP